MRQALYIAQDRAAERERVVVVKREKAAQQAAARAQAADEAARAQQEEAARRCEDASARDMRRHRRAAESSEAATCPLEQRRSKRARKELGEDEDHAREAPSEPSLAPAPGMAAGDEQGAVVATVGLGAGAQVGIGPIIIRYMPFYVRQEPNQS
jgi:hypothetical protein